MRWLDNFLTNTDKDLEFEFGVKWLVRSKQIEDLNLVYYHYMTKKLGLPTSKEYLKTFIEKTILPALKKQSNTLFFPRGMGRNSLLKYISQNKNSIDEQLGINLDNIILLTIDTEDREILKSNWIRMLDEQNIATDELSTLNLHEILHKVTKSVGKRVLLCVWVQTEEMNINFLESLRQTNSMMIDFQFGFRFEVRVEEMKHYLGILTEFALQNIWYMPFYDRDGVKHVVDNQVALGDIPPSDAQFEKIVEYSGGYPSLVRFFIRNLSSLDSSELEKNSEIKHFFDELWDGFSSDSQAEIFSVFSNQTKEITSEYILKTRMFTKDTTWRSFSVLFDRYIKHLLSSLPPEVTMKENSLYVSNEPLELLLSDQESVVLKLLFMNDGKVVDRDEVAKVMWGDNWEEKYSDWAIDQIISRIRKKIGDRASNVLIKTIRGKGFTFVSYHD